MKPFKPSKSYDLEAKKKVMNLATTDVGVQVITEPTLKLGDYVLREHTVYKVIRSKEGELIEVRVGEAVLVDEIIRCLDRQRVDLKLRYRSCHDWQTTIIPRGRLIKTEIGRLRNLGLDVGAKQIDDMLSFVDLHEKEAPVVYTHDKLGWLKYEDELMFRLHDVMCQQANMTSAYQGHLSIQPKGSFEAWKKAVEDHVVGYTPLELILAASLASPLIGLLNITELAEVDSLLINMVGNSTTGKTTAAMVAASVFGSPSLSNNGLIQSFNGTPNAIQSIISGNHGVTLIFDETSMNQMNRSDFSSLIYKLAQNKEKARLNKDAELKEIDRWATVLMFTGESSILDKSSANAGLYVRMFEFKNVQWTMSAEHADTLKDQLLANYGHAGITYIENLIKIAPEEIKQTWDKYGRELQTLLPQTRFLSRISQKFSLILTGAHYAKTCLGIELSIPNITKLLIEQEESSMDIRELAPKFYSMLREYLIKHRRNFKYNNEQVAPTQHIYGKIEVKEGKSFCYILRQQLAVIAEELGFSDVQVLVSELKAQGCMKTEKKRIQVKKQIFKTDEQEARELVLPEQSYSDKGDFTYCFIYEGDFLSEFNESTEIRERRLLSFNPNGRTQASVTDRPLFNEDES